MISKSVAESNYFEGIKPDLDTAGARLGPLMAGPDLSRFKFFHFASYSSRLP